MSLPRFISTFLDSSQLPVMLFELDECLDVFDAFMQDYGQTARQLFLDQIQASFADARMQLLNDDITLPIANLIGTPVAPVSVCFGNPGHEHGAVWLQSAGSELQSNLRDAELHAAAILPSQKRFAIRVPAHTFTSFVQAAWDRLTSQNNRVDDDFEPDTGGDVELRSWTLNSPQSTVSVLQIKGTYHSHIPRTRIGIDVDFVLTITEVLQVLSASNASWVQSSVSQDLSIDRSQVTELEAGLGFLSALGAALGIAASVGGLYDYIEQTLQRQIASFTLPSLALVQQILAVVPSQALIRSTPFKVVFSYDAATLDLSLGGTGLTVSSAIRPTIAPRRPGVFVSGPQQIRVNLAYDNSPTTVAQYSLLTSDLVLPFAAVEWSGAGRFLSQDPETGIASIRFEVAGAPVRSLTVTVTDSDDPPTTVTQSIKVAISTFSQASPTKPKNDKRPTVKPV